MAVARAPRPEGARLHVPSRLKPAPDGAPTEAPFRGLRKSSRGLEPPAEPAGYLTLADWRREVAALYVKVRRLAARDPVTAWDFWRETRERLYREHPQSPVPAAQRRDFRASHFGYDPAVRFEVQVAAELDADASASRLPASAGEGLAFHRLGWLDVPFPAGARRLGLFWLAGYAGGLFLPFRDATSGHETYPAGRYLLDGAKSADLGGNPAHDTLILDFNFAYQPSCAFDARWACPLAPAENWLDLPIRAGECLTRR